ncbi:LysE family transporter [Alphaproteobacteria bacterium]|jgi:L-lysine exporter family protein LysE/ArgO|nr:LysE family transporter [Alphaproteobacteria bacterium]MDC1054441.1 LysE family transporter [Alphaproteobacteria bacterium]|tara:strand:- start:6 stop:605 length:600 start_codon:yes stop_codon:yes gene_type:complete
MSISNFIQGFIIGSSLIIAIGPQNLYVINQGLKKNFVFIVVLICSLSDSLLIVCGIYLSNNILSLNTSIITIMKLIGGIWLILYGINKIKNSRQHEIKSSEINAASFTKVVLTTLAITYANPHVYLDTVILLGSISINFDSKFYFGLGAIFASFIFFFSLGYFSNFLSQYVKSPKVWFYIDNVMGFLMLFYGLFFVFMN